MVFSSVIFLFVFLPAVIVLYRLLPKSIVIRNLFLFLVSSFFYFFGEQKQIFLLYLVILVNYFTGRIVYTGTEEEGNLEPKSGLQKLTMFSCVTFCIGLLWYFKYFHFTWEVVQTLSPGTVGWKEVEQLALPLGISFYTFHVLSYSLDVYFGRMKVEYNLLNFATYVLMFPQLVAGPIVRYRDVCKQFYHRVVTGAGVANGIRRFCFGLAKKVLIANTLAVYVDKIFAVPALELSLTESWLGAIAYTLQIYFDFSGYSDMAIGLALFFGFHYKENFNYPYISRSAGEFWRRWHISLSTWLRDYVYIHLGGSRTTAFKTARNVLIVFLFSGLWHGANFTFVNWGILYGIFIIIENAGLKKFLKKHRVLASVYLLTLVTTAWVIFRADNMQYASSYIATMYGLHGFNLSLVQKPEINVTVAILAGMLLSYDWRNSYKKAVVFLSGKCNKGKAYSPRIFNVARICSFVTAVGVFALSVCSIVSSSHNPFIYFRF